VWLVDPSTEEKRVYCMTRAVRSTGKVCCISVACFVMPGVGDL
jgi:hypothetical protein